jgi:hypothetical protein
MADLEPADLFAYGTPQVSAFLDATVIEQNLRALAQTHYTTDPAKPLDARQGQLRVNGTDPANFKLEARINGAWRTILQHIEINIPAPVKQIAQIVAPSASWIIDHNLGSQPVALAYDSTFRQLAVFTQANPPTDQWAAGFVPGSVLTVAVGPADHGGFVAPFDGFVEGAYLSVAEALTGAPNFIYQPTINNVPVTGGLVSVTGPLATGIIVNSSTVTAANKFLNGQTVRVRLNAGNVAPAAGSVNLFLRVRRADYCFIQHINENRVTVTHPEARTGFVVLVG